MGKGDTRRRSQVPEEQVKSNWDTIFNKREEKMAKLKEYIWHNHCETTEEVTVYAESFEKAQELYLDGEGEVYALESISKWDECVKNSDDFEDDEETNNE